MITIRYLGHSGVTIDDDKSRTAIDPFLTGNPKTPVRASEVAVDQIVLTHAHGDHLGDTVEIARRSAATVYTNFETGNWLGKHGLEKVHAMNTGASRRFAWARLSWTPAWHSNSLPDGSYAGLAHGVILELDGKRIYHAGDTALFGDMALIGEEPIDLAFLPIGDYYTMGPRDAERAIGLLKPRVVVPIHYNTFEPIVQDATRFKRAVEERTKTLVRVLAPGDTFQI